MTGPAVPGLRPACGDSSGVWSGAWPGAWQGGDDELLCVDISDEGPAVRTFWFRAVSGVPFAFRPGQFVFVEARPAAGPAWRCFTVASPPTRPRLIGLTIKRQVGGTATGWLHDAVRPGMRLRAQAPRGTFALDAPPARPLALISAGSGATPMASIARWLYDLRFRGPVHYLHVARTAPELLFRTEIDHIADDLGTWRRTWLTTAGEEGDRAGRPTTEMVRRLMPGLGAAQVYCCGPAGFMAAVRAAFLADGGTPAAFHSESFCARPLPDQVGPDQVGPDRAEAAGTGFAVRLLPSGVTVTADAGETLLTVAARAGLPIPHACRQGICGSCRIRKISGDVEMRHQGGITAAEIAEGDILACCSRARSRLVLELP